MRPFDVGSAPRTSRAGRGRAFYGWRVVAGCLATTAVGNALGLYGAGVYLHAVTAGRGWSAGLVSGAVALFYVVSALLLAPVGAAIGRLGPRPVVAAAGVAMAAGVACVGQAEEPWQAYVAFLAMGIGWSGLSMTAMSAALAPWFERHYGRAVSTASLGASVGGIAGAPVLLLGIEWMGLPATTAVAATVTMVIVLPTALLVLQHRPQDLGLLPDGEPPHAVSAAAPGAAAARWGRAEALRTPALASVVAAFGAGMAAQVGFLAHQVSFAAPALGAAGAAALVAATSAAALAGRLLLAHLADALDARKTAAAALLLAAAALAAPALAPAPAVLVGAGLAFGLTVGNVTTLPAIVVRREFGAASFGAVFGTASTGIWLAAAAGPGLYGMLRDGSGGYALPLLLAAALDVAAAGLVVLGGRFPITAPPWTKNL